MTNTFYFRYLYTKSINTRAENVNLISSSDGPGLWREIINEQYVLEIDSIRKSDKDMHLPLIVSLGRHRVANQLSIKVKGGKKNGRKIRPQNHANFNYQATYGLLPLMG